MKSFSYNWTGDKYLLHVQIDAENFLNEQICIMKLFKDKKIKKEDKPLTEKSHRFIVSRTHPDEVNLTVNYPDEAMLIAYEIDDRAYYPTEEYFRG